MPFTIVLVSVCFVLVSLFVVFVLYYSIGLLFCLYVSVHDIPVVARRSCVAVHWFCFIPSCACFVVHFSSVIPCSFCGTVVDFNYVSVCATESDNIVSRRICKNNSFKSTFHTSFKLLVV